jgi:5-hydroxyisourate hydrolase
MTSVSTHVLDTATGLPGVGIEVVLERSIDGGWQYVGEGVTDVNGRIPMLAAGVTTGIYRLVFSTGAASSFFPKVEIVVSLDDEEDHYHIPLLISPYGYTTYRGS